MEARTSPDRKASFGRVAILVEREGVRITRDGAFFQGQSFAADEIKAVELARQEGRPNLAWLLYSAIAALTALQAYLTREPALWAIAGGRRNHGVHRLAATSFARLLRHSRGQPSGRKVRPPDAGQGLRRAHSRRCPGDTDARARGLSRRPFLKDD